MKLSTFLFLSILSALIYTAQGQTPVEFKYKSDPGYSVHNYKHPHKAAIAKKYNLDKLISINYVEPIQANDLAKRNYKLQAVQTDMPVSGAVIVVNESPQYRHSIDSPANYKRQFRPKTVATK